MAEEGQSVWIWREDKRRGWNSEILRDLPQAWCFFPNLGRAQGNREQLPEPGTAHRAQAAALAAASAKFLMAAPGLPGWERTPELSDATSRKLITRRTWKKLLWKWLCSHRRNYFFRHAHG